MSTLSDALTEALAPRPSRPRLPSGERFLVSTDLHESADPWMSDFMRQVQIVAPKYEAYLKKATGRSFKLFRTFLTDEGRIRVRFDPTKRASAYEFGPMVLLKVAYSKSADLYSAHVEVYDTDASTVLGSHQVTEIDIELLADPERMLHGVRDALRKVAEKKTGKSAAPAVTSRAKERLDDKGIGEGLAGELDRILTEARLGNSAEGGSLGQDRVNPTKSGPAAERERTLRGAKDGIDRMLKALETVREWVGKLQLGSKDKTGAASAALRIALNSIGQAEDVQRVLGQIVELPAVDLDAMARVVFETLDYLDERKATAPSADALRAKEGLAKLVDGLRQLQGMLRQAKVTGRVLDQVEAAINGLKSTRDAVDELSECMGDVAKSVGPIDPDERIPYGRFVRRPVAEVKAGMWVEGGQRDMGGSYHRVKEVNRTSDTGDVILYFSKPYIGADGSQKHGVRFPSDFKVLAADPY